MAIIPEENAGMSEHSDDLVGIRVHKVVTFYTNPHVTPKLKLVLALLNARWIVV